MTTLKEYSHKLEDQTTADLKRELNTLQAFLKDENSAISKSDLNYEHHLIKELDERESSTL